ncbi:MAG TPA: SPFH domain-containing protein [Chthonomonadaceae bacterium]|nr:SPFH domain-containing protein [Chthonomonadaceae bacterium]
MPILPIVGILFLLLIISSAFKVLSNWERAVVLRLGKYNRTVGPGMIFLLPWVDRAYRVDTRIVTLDVPRQEMMTKDNVPVTVDAIVLFNVIDPNTAILKIENYARTTNLIAQTTLRSTIGQAELDELLSQRERINEHLKKVIDEQTEPYGVKVTAVEVRDVSLPETMKRAMAAQAEAEREKRAKIINSEGEFLAAERLVQAAGMMAKEPAALQLRYLQSMREIASERSTMTILPIPIDLVSPFIEMMKRNNVRADAEDKAAAEAKALAAGAQPSPLVAAAPAASLPAAGTASAGESTQLPSPVAGKAASLNG